jgi:pyruvate,water dikinase
MSKYSQLVKIKAAGLNVPRFESLSWDAFRQKGGVNTSLWFPLAVRSTYVLEDGAHQSFAGAFRTELHVEKEHLSAAIDQVFASYPQVEDQEVILQEMVHADYSGVLFAYRQGVWKVELAAGAGEAIVSGHAEVQSIILPQFLPVDQFFSSLWLPWRPPGLQEKSLRRPLLQLSVGARKLLAQEASAEHGLDIEFSIAGGKLYFLQARPITTPREAEQVLTSANHREILPPAPSPFMTSVINSAGPDLYKFYQQLDPQLPDRSFILEAEGMPWINLSALMDTMVFWGLPTQLVARSVGASDYYQLGWRPWRFFTKIPVFLRLRKQQKGIARKIKDWVNKQRNKQRIHRLERVLLWQTDAPAAAEDLIQDFRQFYIDLVTQMQLLTGAMSGPVALFNRLGLMRNMAKVLGKTSASTDYYRAFQELSEGRMSRKRFLRNYGHRGFYESDIGQARFQEYSEQEWISLLQNNDPQDAPRESMEEVNQPQTPFYLRGVVTLIHSREWIRHMSMQFFWAFRKEMMREVARKMGPDFNPWDYRPEDLLAQLRGEKWLEEIESYPEPSGWDINTFLCNGYGRRIPLEPDAETEANGIGIYPGKVRGQVWRVQAAQMAQLNPPPYDNIILVADALDPGWVPYFTKVDGVISYVGGLLSHASIILREAGIPAITQLPAKLDLPEGTWVEMDGKKGTVNILEQTQLETSKQ